MRAHRSSHGTILVLACVAMGSTIGAVLLWQTALASDNQFLELATVASTQAQAADIEMESRTFSGIELEKNIGLPSRIESPTQQKTPERVQNITEATGAPVRLNIPSIGVNAPIERVALTAAGSMDVPKHPLDAGWYKLGPKPGDIGNATIAGHVDWYGGATAVFANLHKVQPGDTITVVDDRGETKSFVVRETRTYDASAAATDVFVSTDGEAHLNLITCVGDWDTQSRQYSHRLVVFTDLVKE